jgi:hypothetical protein
MGPFFEIDKVRLLCTNSSFQAQEDFLAWRSRQQKVLEIAKQRVDTDREQERGHTLYASWELTWKMPARFHSLDFTRHAIQQQGWMGTGNVFITDI